MYAEERQQAIAAQVIAQGRASVAELAQTYDVTTETVRRDLAVLDRAGTLRRVHGGAVPARSLLLAEPSVDQREATRTEQKRAIARAATDYLPRSGSSAALDAGTTTAQLAALLPADRELRIVTNSVPIAARLAGMPSVALHVLGGRVRGETQACVGPQVVRDLSSLRVDIAFLRNQRNHHRPRPVHSRPERGRRQAGHGRVRQLRRGVGRFLQDRAEDFVSFAPLDRVDVLVTDSEISDVDRTRFTREGLEVTVARDIS